MIKTVALDKDLREIWKREARNPHQTAETNFEVKKGPGTHGLITADVDEDGRDELVLGATALDDDGTVLWETELTHPDPCFVADIDPRHPGLEVFFGIEPSRYSHGVCLASARAASQGDLRLRVRAVEQMVSISNPTLFRYHLLFMHGRHEFRLTPAERELLGTYLRERQGTLLADAICASKPFAMALRREVQLALPNESFQRIPPDDPLFTQTFGGYDIRQVTLRDPRATGDDGPVQVRFQQVEPQLLGIKIDDRWAVISSAL